MSTPNAENLSLGAGNVYFDRFDAAGKSTGFRHCGNVEQLNRSVTVETKEKKSSMSGARGILKSANVGSEAELSLLFNEYDSENLALAFLGTEAAFLQNAQASVTAGVINGGQAIVLDRWYSLGALNVTVTDLKQGVTTLTVGTDYEVNAEAGMVRVLSTGVGTAAVTTWDGSVPAIVANDGKRVIQGLAVGKIEGAIRFISATDQAAGPRFIADWWKVSITPDGDLPFISEDFGAFTLKAKVQIDSTKAAGEQYERIIKL